MRSDNISSFARTSQQLTCLGGAVHALNGEHSTELTECNYCCSQNSHSICQGRFQYTLVHLAETSGPQDLFQVPSIWWVLCLFSVLLSSYGYPLLLGSVIYCTSPSFPKSLATRLYSSQPGKTAQQLSSGDFKILNLCMGLHGAFLNVKDSSCLGRTKWTSCLSTN